jgi:uncharacterized protein
MKRLLLILSLLVSVCAFAQIDEVIPAKQSPPKLVNDYTKTLTPYQVADLEKKLEVYDDSTSNQITVVVISSTKNYTVEEVALELGRRWGVGNKEINNGVVLLVAKDDRKMTIQVGYGLEGALPDITAKSIIENEITPSFKDGNYYRGLDHGTDAIIKATKGEYKAPANYGSKKKKGLSAGAIVIIIILLIIFFSGAGPGAAGTYVSRGGFTGWSGGGGGGGSGWSGGGSSGGFGGFGGGSFGGGGASGSW